ncbi:MAG: type I restriction endonuclease [Planctomycetes bacterium]|nr:type I restriction endonuclease [Planctomycetota bacterium]
MPDEIEPQHLLEIAGHHLGLVREYDPYQSFPGVTSREQFRELIRRDPAFAPLGLDDDRYLTARIGGNLVTSLHRKIGDMYGEMFAYLIGTRFGLTKGELSFSVQLRIGRRVQARSTDGMIPRAKIGGLALPRLPRKWADNEGIAFEVRSCYQIGDSKRIQADYDMALALKRKRLVPVMLVFCTTSLRSPLARLAESWVLFEGMDAFQFIRELTGFDLHSFLESSGEHLRSHVGAALSKL